MYRIFQTVPKVLPYPAYQNSIIRKISPCRFLKYKRLKLNLRVFLASHSVAMVTYCVTKIIPVCSPMIGQCFDTMIGVFLASHSVAMVTYCVTKIIPTCSPMIEQCFDTMIVASIDKEWL